MTDRRPIRRYVSTLSDDEIERIRRWHEQAYLDAQDEGDVRRTFLYLGMTIQVPSGVMPVTSMSYVLGEAVLREVRVDDVVLDMGTGSGINAIIAARAGSGRVLAVDVSPTALETARRNAERNDVAGRVEVRASDVFEAVPERVDLIIFDPPYRWFPPRDELEAAITDDGYGAMIRFFEGARPHLTDGGRMLVSFATSGDIGFLRQLIAEEGFREEVVGHAEVERDGELVEYFAFRLT